MIKEELKNLLLSLKEEDYVSNVDLHIHSSESDGNLAPDKIVEQAKQKGLKYIAISDHNTIDAYLKTNILSSNIVIPAVEFDCFFKGVLIHILGYGINIDNKEIKSLFSKSEKGKKSNFVRIFALRNPKVVIEKIKKAGGIAILAHPCCYWTLNLEKFIASLVDMRLDGVETYYPYMGARGVVKFHANKKVIEIAEKYNLIKTGGSDFHGEDYFNSL